MGFEVIDISGDVGIRAQGADLKETFANAARGMLSLITDLNKIQGEKEIKITLQSHSLEGLLVSWLNELIFQFDAYGFTAKDFSIDELRDNKISAVVKGQDFDHIKHERRLLLKAATYHKVKIENKDGMWQAEVIFDI